MGGSIPRGPGVHTGLADAIVGVDFLEVAALESRGEDEGGGAIADIQVSI